ncbi:pentapeptide repeat-containing protein [Synechocystis sp. CS-94]|nr:hypothetical protein D082_11060 [Synechocystis sp. PCC 6714]MCT0254995.1 pentapeptide repeat-containing protein [Synechocystis sp. CS-94]
MVDNSQVQTILSQYQGGKRNFQNLALRRIDFHGISLVGADFSGSDFGEANLRGANLQGCNFQEAYFNSADLSGANLEEANLKRASLLKTFLLKANLRGTHLEEAIFVGAVLTRANLEGAYLQGASLTGADLAGAKLTDAQYNDQTRFDIGFNPEKLALKKVTESGTNVAQVGATNSVNRAVTNQSPLPNGLSVEDLLLTFEHLGNLGNHYLGNTMAGRYLQSTQPKGEWFAQFEVDKKSVKLSYKGSKEDKLTPEQIEAAQGWAQQYVKSCTMIFKTFPTMIKTDQCVFNVIG